MNAASPNTLNLLLGTAPVADSNRVVEPGFTAEKPSFDILFGELLELQKTHGSTALPQGTETLESRSPKGLSFAAPGSRDALKGFDLLSFTAAADQSEPAGISEKTAAASDAKPILPNPIMFPGAELPTPGNRQSVSDAETLPSEPASPVPDFRTSPAGVQVSNDPFAALQTGLNPGSYRILDWSIRGDSLDLQLVPEHAPQQTVKVTIPLAQLELASDAGIASRAAMTGQRVALDDTVTQQLKIDYFFSKLNLKELKVESSPSPQQPANVQVQRPELMHLKLFAEDLGNEVVIRGTLVQPQAKTRPDPGLVNGRVAVELPGESSSKTGVLTRAAVAAPANMSGGTPDGSPNRFGWSNGAAEMTHMSKGSTYGEKPDSTDTQVLPNFARSTGEIMVNRSRLDVHPARFMLPDNLHATLKPNGKSIQIKIDPQHLGPARLNLTMHDDSLRAVLTVDTIQARNAIEGSLDRLLDALARADVKVDSIEVTVDQQGTREEIFDGRAREQRPRRIDRFNGIENEMSAASMAATATMSTGYLGAGGVNVLA